MYYEILVKIVSNTDVYSTRSINSILLIVFGTYYYTINSIILPYIVVVYGIPYDLYLVFCTSTE